LEDLKARLDTSVKKRINPPLVRNRIPDILSLSSNFYLHTVSKSPVNPVVNPNPVCSHSVTWLFYLMMEMCNSLMHYCFHAVNENKTDKNSAHYLFDSSHGVQFKLLLWKNPYNDISSINRRDNLQSNVCTQLRNPLISNNVMLQSANIIFVVETRCSDNSLIFSPFQKTVRRIEAASFRVLPVSSFRAIPLI
jgi:hypothetical protein